MCAVNAFRSDLAEQRACRFTPDCDAAFWPTRSSRPSTREAIHLTVAAVNACEYCQAAYTGSSKKTGFTDEQTIQIREGDVDDDTRLIALLSVAREIAANRGYVDDATWKTAIDAGRSDRELHEAYADVVRTILTNHFNHLVRTELDLPPAPSR